jgi:hypothetical protein
MWTATNGQFIKGAHSPSGFAFGATEFDAADAGPVPIAFVALTVKV